MRLLSLSRRALYVVVGFCRSTERNMTCAPFGGIVVWRRVESSDEMTYLAGKTSYRGVKGENVGLTGV